MNSQKSWFIEESIHQNLGHLSRDGALVVATGKYTGRAVNDRYISNRSESFDKIAWSKTNQEIDSGVAREFLSAVSKKLNCLEDKVFEFNGYVGPFPIRVRSSSPWHIAFAENMFRQTPSFTVPGFPKDKRIEIDHLPYDTTATIGVNFPNPTLLVLDAADLKVGIVGTAYAGEIKKSAFTLCNFLLPEHGFLSMHSSANCLEDGSNSCVLFGLSGTGKTTLSASPDRYLIGDDEIVWSHTGISNLEGGCYAKLIDLSLESEPEIFKAVNQFGSIMENVGFDPRTGIVDFSDRVKTENTRGSYSLEALSKVFPMNKEAEAPRSIVFLTADAFGVMPAVARLDEWQAQYYFVSGYTAKVAGTELGVKEPQAAFSTCFGAPFMPRPSNIYAGLLAEFAKKSGAQFWLLNTGWMSGGYGKSQRYPLKVSRQILSSIQSGELAKQKTKKHSVFNFEVPTQCPNMASQYLEFDDLPGAKILAEKFHRNMENFSSHMEASCLQNGGPSL
ncbi:MAG: phosphoenolpyruvate carboxykinase (ATP) [Deltaproteobacteria bacterium CG11_big_fil_rev_8_21_14_0_20_45_16]|nr:MAG: phosphoenolpyruvate carboxykinase (ATP) [Deltaproteobacteria bacterium CG11_big_fil_rev_8_21_14_0_20_45_16]